MSFQARQLSVTFQIGTSADFTQIDLAGYRCECVIQNVGGDVASANMILQIYGMSQNDMNILSTDGRNAIATRGDTVIINAGVAGNMRQVFSGNIRACYINYASAPDVCLIVQANTGSLNQAKGVTPNSFKGVVDVTTICSALAVLMGYQFANNGVTSQLRDQYLEGTLFDQLNAVVKAANILCSIENNVLTIWPNGGSVGTDITEYSPSTGLIGYPTFDQATIKARVEFDPNTTIGRKVKLTTSVLKANNTFYVVLTTHTIETFKPDGAWFTDLTLAYQGLYGNS